MDLNSDFSQRVSAHTKDNKLLMLERIGGEMARATTIVRFAPGSSFSPHTHDGGE